MLRLVLSAAFWSHVTVPTIGFVPPVSYHRTATPRLDHYATAEADSEAPSSRAAALEDAESVDGLFQEFVTFLQDRQSSIIAQIEAKEKALDAASDASFTRDCWGMFADATPFLKSGGITRVLQGGGIVEKGACSLTIIQQGVLTAERAATVRARQQVTDDGDFEVAAGDVYSAAALSMVLHTRSPLVPTFRSDVRVFMVKQSAKRSMAWFGGGADLTPYYLDEDDISSFHGCYKDLCDNYFDNGDKNIYPGYNYQAMKQACDEYFYLPARSEHRGTGGIFWDDLPVSRHTLEFAKGVADTWMPSWFPIVDKHASAEYTEQQKQWQLLRRGRYLEFNLLYDRGVKFGLAQANPRVEGVMVSAPPQIAYEYCHTVEPDSPEAALQEVLKTPRASWVK